MTKERTCKHSLLFFIRSQIVWRFHPTQFAKRNTKKIKPFFPWRKTPMWKRPSGNECLLWPLLHCLAPQPSRSVFFSTKSSILVALRQRNMMQFSTAVFFLHSHSHSQKKKTRRRCTILLVWEITFVSFPVAEILLLCFFNELYEFPLLKQFCALPINFCPVSRIS